MVAGGHAGIKIVDGSASVMPEVTMQQKTKETFQIQFMKDLKEDLKNRLPLWVQDWRDGLAPQTVAASLFLYFACLAPAVAFGGLSAALTGGQLGVVEVLMATGFGGAAYSFLSGQPMTFIGPTGLTLVFTAALHSFCALRGLPFLPMFSWVGLWTSGFLALLSATGASNGIKYCTQFTDDVFNSLLAVNFVYEALRSLGGNFRAAAAAGADQTSAFFSLNLALAYYALSRRVTAFRGTRYLSEQLRGVAADLGPVAAIFALSALAHASPIPVATLRVPAGGRALLVPLGAVPGPWRLLAAAPALLLTTLFYLDMNITVRTVNAPRHRLRKPVAYHQDLGALAVITLGLSLCGLPWMCAATVQSLAHVRSMAEFEEDGGEVIARCRETRLTGLAVHGGIAASLLLLPVIAQIPMPVVSGIFLFLGRRIMTGNGFLGRLKSVWAEKAKLPEDHPVRAAGRGAALRYTAVQAACLGGLWALKMNPATALYFPSVIGVLMGIRIWILPHLFSEEELKALDSSVGEG